MAADLTPPDANGSAAAPPVSAKPRRRQVHLSTLILLMFVAAGMLYLNAVPHDFVKVKFKEFRWVYKTTLPPLPGEEPKVLDESDTAWNIKTYREATHEFGWPLLFLTKYAAEPMEYHRFDYNEKPMIEIDSFYREKPFKPVRGGDYNASTLPLLLDLLVFVLTLVGTGLVVEGFFRQRAGRSKGGSD